MKWRLSVLLITGLAWSGFVVGCDSDPDPVDGGTMEDAFVAPDTGPEDSGVTEDAGDDDAGPVDAGPADAGPPTCGSTVGQLCRFDADCGDPCFCNGNELCQGGRCVAGPAQCDDSVGCTTDVCDEEARTCTNTTDDSVCDDMNSCTGIEICDAELGCLAGIPTNCSDGNSCTLDSCDPVLGCQNVLRDLDGDGYASNTCEGGLDCNDDPMTGGAIYPGAMEICDDGIDNNCDGIADYFDTTTCRPSNDTCMAARVLESAGTYAFSTNGLNDDYELSCGTSGTHPDAVFQFSTTAARDVTIGIAGSPFSSVVELRALADCESTDSSAAVACDRDTSSFGSDTAELSVTSLPAGDYVILVSTVDEGFYSLDLRITSPVPPPREDICNAYTPVISASGTYSSAFATLADDHPSLSCRDQTGARPEAAYRLSLTTASDVSLSANGYSSTGYQRDIAMALVRDCGNPVTSEIACETADFTTSPADIDIRPLPAGDYWILIEEDDYSFYPVEGFELIAEVTVPPPPQLGDSCVLPADITAAPQTIDLATMRNDGGLGCGGGSLAYRDLAFSFEVATESSVTLETSGPFHLLALSSTCTDTSTEVACQASDATGSGTITQTLAAGTYYLRVAIPDNMGMVTATATITPTTTP